MNRLKFVGGDQKHPSVQIMRVLLTRVSLVRDLYSYVFHTKSYFIATSVYLGFVSLKELVKASRLHTVDWPD